jgi:dTDP-4-dehydrorhamnose 3,5-epimerase
MNVIPTRLPGAVIFEPKAFPDPRGFLMETWSQRRYAALGLPERFVQDNLSYSVKGVLRGLHLQAPCPQGKLISVVEGEVFDVAVDLRQGSPTFAQWVGVTLSAENKRQLYVPEGLAHGFVVTGDCAIVLYKCTEFYSPEHELSLLWNDPDLGIEWPLESPALSSKDRNAPRLRELPIERLPQYEGKLSTGESV